MPGTGAVEIDFGNHPGLNESSVTITGLTDILSTSKAEAFFMGDDTTVSNAVQMRKMNDEEAAIMTILLAA
jgi:hypothetical protein